MIGEPNAQTDRNVVHSPSSLKGFNELKHSGIPMNFIERNNGCWDHDKWVLFLEEIRNEGYEIEDSDQVGLLLEIRKEQFFTRQLESGIPDEH